MKAKKLIFPLLLLLGSTAGYGQGHQLGGPVADAKLSATSAAQGMGGLFSPNLYDGSATINVPIYQYSVENSDFGVSFSYNTKGVKTDELAGDAGLHFLINSGATIHRTQKDLPDEINLLDGDTTIYLPYFSVTPNVPGIPLPPADTVSLNPYWCFKGRYACYSESTASQADEGVYRDAEADDFVVSLGSGTFTFQLAGDGTVFTHPHRNVKVELLWDGQPFGAIADQQPVGGGAGAGINKLSFRIRDEQGNTYVFAPNEYSTKPIEDAYGKGNPLSMYFSPESWKIARVELANGSSIVYNYTDGDGRVTPLSIAYSLAEGVHYFDNALPSVISSSGHDDKLQSIQYPNGTTVQFTYDNDRGRRDYRYGALREISVGTGMQRLRYIMQQSFFYADPATPVKNYEAGTFSSSGGFGYTVDSMYRLRLDGILLCSSDSTQLEPYYSFGYEGTAMQGRLSPFQDFFGYPNAGPYQPIGATIQDLRPTRVPRHNTWFLNFVDLITTYSNDYGMTKTPNTAKMKAGMLTEVRNAYGGRAVFHYSGHTDLATPVTGLPADDWYLGKLDPDGLRLDSIIEWEKMSPANKKVTIFEYSDGQIFMPGGYFNYTSMLKGTDSLATQKIRQVMTSSYLTSHQLVNGSNHGYTNVTVTTRLGEGGPLLSRKVLKFSNLQDAGGAVKYVSVGSGKKFFEYPYTDKQYLMDWALGLPLEVTEYDQNNRIVQKTINKYRFTLDTVTAIGKVDNQRIGLIPVAGWNVPGVGHVINNKKVRDFYRPFTGAALLDTTIVQKYISDNAFVADTVRYHYDSRNNMDIVWARNSKGQTIQTNQAYNYTLSSPLGSPLLLMTQAGLEKMVGTERWILGSGGNTTHRLVDAFFNTFNYTDGKLSPKYLYNLQTGSPLTYAQYTGYTGGGSIPEPFAHLSAAFGGNAIANFVKTSEVTVSDNRRNPLETRMMGQDLYKAMIWDTISGRKLAEANCQYNDMAYSGFEATVKGNWEYSIAGVSSLTDALAGQKGYRMYYGPVSRTSFTAGKEYVVAFWSTNYSTMTVCNIGSNPVSLTQGPTKGNWTYYEGRFTAPSSSSVLSITNSSSNSYVDEVRLFPVSASLQAWSYKGMFGAGAVTAPNGRVSYYEYDKLGRQVIVRDQDGNILGKTEHHVQQ